MTLDNEDIDMLLNALKELEDADGKTEALGSLVGAMMQPSEADAKRYLSESRSRAAHARAESKLMAERIMVLKAKLVQMRPPVFEPKPEKAKA